MKILQNLFDLSENKKLVDELTGVEMSIFDYVLELEKKVSSLQEKYEGALNDIRQLEEENVETSNCLYELQNSIEAVDHRIDIVLGEFKNYGK